MSWLHVTHYSWICLTSCQVGVSLYKPNFRLFYVKFMGCFFPFDLICQYQVAFLLPSLYPSQVGLQIVTQI